MKRGVGLRGVLALLCLLASFAYSAREWFIERSSWVLGDCQPLGFSQTRTLRES